MSAPMIGIDLVEPGRLGERLDGNPALAEELFHPEEIAYSQRQPSPVQCLAARFAAKEAVIKALGIDGFEPLDVEVVGGGPDCRVMLHGAAALRAEELGVHVTLSFTHLDMMAAAVAMARTTR